MPKPALIPRPPRRSPFALAITLYSLAFPLLGQTPLDTNLLIDPSFEAPALNAWAAVRGSVTTTPYSTPSFADNRVAAFIGGGRLMAIDNGSGGNIIEQRVPLAPNAQGLNCILRGFVGGSRDDFGTFALIFEDSAGNVLGRDSSLGGDRRLRNQELVLVEQVLRTSVPSTAATAVVRVEFIDNCCNGRLACVDHFDLQVTNQSHLPPARPLNTELIVNGGFEAGWFRGSPLSLLGEQSWSALGAPTLRRPPQPR